jgi:hypothetical protein
MPDAGGIGMEDDDVVVVSDANERLPGEVQLYPPRCPLAAAVEIDRERLLRRRLAAVLDAHRHATVELAFADAIDATVARYAVRHRQGRRSASEIQLEMPRPGDDTRDTSFGWQREAHERDAP